MGHVAEELVENNRLNVPPKAEVVPGVSGGLKVPGIRRFESAVDWAA
jgi:hypothetical protein